MFYSLSLKWITLQKIMLHNNFCAWIYNVLKMISSSFLCTEYSPLLGRNTFFWQGPCSCDSTTTSPQGSVLTWRGYVATSDNHGYHTAPTRTLWAENVCLFCCWQIMVSLLKSDSIKDITQWWTLVELCHEIITVTVIQMFLKAQQYWSLLLACVRIS